MLVTDGSLGIGKGSLRHSLQTLKQRGDDKKFPLPFPFPTKLFIMCIANAEEVLNDPFLAAFTIINFCLLASSSILWPPVLCNCSYRWLMLWTIWRNYFVSVEGTDRSSPWRDRFAWRVYRPCLGMTVTEEINCTFSSLFTCLLKHLFCHFTSLFLGGWLTTHTPLSMQSCTVGTCPQTFRCSLVLSL